MTKAQKFAILVGELDTELKARSTKELISDVAWGGVPHTLPNACIQAGATAVVEGVCMVAGVGVLGTVLAGLGTNVALCGARSWIGYKEEWKVLASRALGGVESKATDSKTMNQKERVAALEDLLK